MKKIAVGILLFLAKILVVSAKEKPVFDCGDQECGAGSGLEILLSFLGGTGIIQGTSLVEVILAVVKVALTILGTIAFVAFVWAGGLYIFAFLNEENAETAKKVMIWTAVGIVVILLSYAITSFLITLTA